MEHVAAYLGTEACVGLFAAQLRQLVLALFDLELDQPALEQTHRVLAVLELRALGLGGHHDASWLVLDADGGADLVDVLAAGTTRAVRLELDIFVLDVD